MRNRIESGSGSVTTIAVVGTLVALTCGLLEGVSVITTTTQALRIAEGRAVAVATLVSEGERDPCGREPLPVVDCSVSGTTATVTVEVRGARATATAGPQH